MSINIMIVCVCKRVNDKTIEELIKNGNTSLEDFKRELGLGDQCGRCVDHTVELIKAKLTNSKKLIA